MLFFQDFFVEALGELQDFSVEVLVALLLLPLLLRFHHPLMFKSLSALRFGLPDAANV